MLTPGFFLQVCVPRGIKDVCVPGLSHSSVMSHIICLNTPLTRFVPEPNIFLSFSSPLLCPSLCRSTLTRPSMHNVVCTYKYSPKSLSFVNQSIQLKALLSDWEIHKWSVFTAYVLTVFMLILGLYIKSTAWGVGLLWGLNIKSVGKLFTSSVWGGVCLRFGRLQRKLILCHNTLSHPLLQAVSTSHRLQIYSWERKIKQR